MSDAGPLGILGVGAAVLLGVVGWRATDWPPPELGQWQQLYEIDDGDAAAAPPASRPTRRPTARKPSRPAPPKDAPEDGFDDEPAAEPAPPPRRWTPPPPPAELPPDPERDPAAATAGRFVCPPIPPPAGSTWTEVARFQDQLLGKLYVYDAVAWPQRLPEVEVGLQIDAQPWAAYVAWRGEGAERRAIALMLAYASQAPNQSLERGHVIASGGWIGIAGQYLLRVRHDRAGFAAAQKAGETLFVQPNPTEAFDVRALSPGARSYWTVQEHRAGDRPVAVTATLAE